MEILFTTKHSDKLEAGYIEYSRPNGKLRVQLMTSIEPIATLSVYVDGISLEKDEFVAKTIDENEGLNEQFLKDGIFSDTGKTCSLGWATLPIYRVN